jgi:TldD protein
VIEKGILKALLMSRTPSQEIAHSNGHARAPRFAAPHVHVGNLIVTSTAPGLARKPLLARMEKTAKAGGLETYVVRLLEDSTVAGGDGDDMSSLFSFGMGGGRGGPPPVRPLVVYRVKDGQEQLVRGLTLEGLLPRSLKEITAVGNAATATVYNFVDSGGGGTGIPSSIVTPALLFSDVDIRRVTGKNRKPPLYPRPAAATTTASASGDSRPRE